jgi:hypothetical protein
MENKYLFPVAFSVAAVFLISVGSVTGQSLVSFEKDRFISPGVCGSCHSSLYDMWDGTMHANAFEDPLFIAEAKRTRESDLAQGEVEKAENCLSCHNPIAFRSGQIGGNTDDFEKADEITRRGVNCDLCHTIGQVVKVADAAFNASPGYGSEKPGIKLGPRRDAVSSYHESAFSSLHTSSEICGTCHNERHPSYGTHLQSTYDEWKASPYYSNNPKKTTVCQDCHMRQTPGRPATGMVRPRNYPGQSAFSGKKRPHIYQHYVVGANTLIPSINYDSEIRLMAEERLKHAATLEIIFDRQLTNFFTSFRVRIRNEGAGHKLPTGVTGYRQMWLEVEAVNQYGKTILKSGGITDTGALEDGTRIFGTVFGDSKGNPTNNAAKAARILSDRRINPGGRADETFRIEGRVRGELTIKAALKYRSMDPFIVRELIGEMDVPVVTMVERTVIYNRQQ